MLSGRQVQRAPQKLRRHDVLDGSGRVVLVEWWDRERLVASWPPSFQATLESHPAVLSELAKMDSD